MVRIRIEFKTKNKHFDVWPSLNGVCERFQKSDPAFSIMPRNDANSVALKNFKVKEQSASNFNKFFESTEPTRQGEFKRYWVICQVTLKDKSLQDLKEDHKAYLQANEIYVYVHRFKEVAVSTAGILINVHPDHVNREHVISKLNKLGKEHDMAFDCVVRNRTFSSTDPESSKDKKTTTKVLEIQCPSHNHAATVDFLKTKLTFPSNADPVCHGAVFVSSDFKKDLGYSKLNLAIGQHHDIISDLVAIPITGLKPELLDFTPDGYQDNIGTVLFNELRQNTGMVHSLQPTKRSESEGRYLVICHKDTKNTVKSRIDEVLEELRQAPFAKEFTFEGTRLHRPTAIVMTAAEEYKKAMMAMYGKPAETLLEKQREKLAVQNASTKRPAKPFSNPWNRKNASFAIYDQKEYQIITKAAASNTPSQANKTRPNHQHPVAPAPQDTVSTTPEVNTSAIARLEERLAAREERREERLEARLEATEARLNQSMTTTLLTAVAEIKAMFQNEITEVKTEVENVKNTTHDLLQRVSILEQELMSPRQATVSAQSPRPLPVPSPPAAPPLSSLGRAASGPNTLFRQHAGTDQSMDMNESRISHVDDDGDDDEALHITVEDHARLMEEAYNHEVAALPSQGRGKQP